MSFHIKYRPKVFDEFYGNQVLVDNLKTLFENVDDMPRVFLFSGPQGCGKTTLAYIIGNKIGCSDIISYNVANTRGIDSSRKIINDSKFIPLEGKYKLFLLDECHKMTNEGQNALLKILEDVPSHVYFVLCTTEPQKLLKTIRDRCVLYTVQPLGTREIKALISDICEKEGIKFDREIINKVADVSSGYPRKALLLLNKIAYEKDKEKSLKIIDEDNVSEYEIKNICSVLLSSDKNKWSKMTQILNGISNDPENVRWAILGYMNKVILNPNTRNIKTIAEIINIFSESYIYCGKAGLSRDCFYACFL